MGYIIWIIVFIFLLLISAYIAMRMFGISSVTRLFTGGGGKFALFVQDPWYAEIEAGRKTVEARVGDEKKFQDLVGKNIVLLGGPGKRLPATVTGIRHYKDLDTYIKKEGWKKVAPHAGGEKEAKAAYLAIKNKEGVTVYSDENVKEKGGVIAIEIELAK